MRRYWLGALMGAAAVGIPLGILTADGVETAQPSPDSVQLPPEPEPDSTIRVVGMPSSSSSATLKATAIGALIGGGGAVLAQIAAGQINRRHRRDDRKLERIDSMLEALDALEVAYAEDIVNDDPDADVSTQLAAAERKFSRSVRLVSGRPIRESADRLQSALQRYALTYGETEEPDRPTLHDIRTLQDDLMRNVKAAVRELR